MMIFSYKVKWHSFFDIFICLKLIREYPPENCNILYIELVILNISPLFLVAKFVDYTDTSYTTITLEV